ncbi:hypothetical protein J3458_007012 [Metarhizium acridum]|uniref:uncharacterized protein n=1 Tax=Metarhizium acridum TaxID=92637 RepID=UPI001C6BC978|nr:hypothetical protein J3458_007012 [Metarhizium acridum]
MDADDLLSRVYNCAVADFLIMGWEGKKKHGATEGNDAAPLYQTYEDKRLDV